MNTYWRSSDGEIYHGNVLEVLKSMASESVQCVVTSPPYWGLRDYGNEPVIWDDPGGCEHVWGDEISGKNKTNSSESVHKNGFKDAFRNSSNYVDHVSDSYDSQGQFCQHCNAWRGSLGLEPTPELFIKHMVQIFSEVKRVLRKDGTCWVNMGDSYMAQGAWGGCYTKGLNENKEDTLGLKHRELRHAQLQSTLKNTSLKPKDLCGIPWRLAFALQNDGWWLRQDIIWHKPNPMPESVTDRCTKAHEYIFLLTKSAKYYYDADIIREPQSNNTHARFSKSVENGSAEPPPAKENGKELNRPGYDKWREYAPKTFIGNRNKRSVWTIPTQPMPEAHFATFPKKLIEPCILAGTSEKGCCVECGAPWERVVEKEYSNDNSSTNHIVGGDKSIGQGWVGSQRRAEVKSKTIGWKAGCNCNAQTMSCVVLDPFLGSGTTGLVAYKHGRKFIGIELNKKYLDDIAIPKITKARQQRKLF